ncbi:MAG TPA: hypothetical protein VD968_10955, partial [Pyrinomonadaceae bacterium]|nr:hypothetical protein [Pyrinomonadaceae bacterium]
DRGEVTLDGLVKYLQERVPKQVQIDLGAGKAQKPFAVIEGYKADELVLSVAEAGGRGLSAAPKDDEPEQTEPQQATPANASPDKGREASGPLKLEGTAWEGYSNDSGPFTVEFLPEGKLRYTHLFTGRATGGTWKQLGEFVQVSLGGYSNFNGRLEGGALKGEGSNAEGVKWKWELKQKEK